MVPTRLSALYVVPSQAPFTREMPPRGTVFGTALRHALTCRLRTRVAACETVAITTVRLCEGHPRAWMRGTRRPARSPSRPTGALGRVRAPGTNCGVGCSRPTSPLLQTRLIRPRAAIWSGSGPADRPSSHPPLLRSPFCLASPASRVLKSAPLAPGGPVVSGSAHHFWLVFRSSRPRTAVAVCLLGCGHPSFDAAGAR